MGAIIGYTSNKGQRKGLNQSISKFVEPTQFHGILFTVNCPMQFYLENFSFCKHHSLKSPSSVFNTTFLNIWKGFKMFYSNINDSLSEQSHEVRCFWVGRQILQQIGNSRRSDRCFQFILRKQSKKRIMLYFLNGPIYLT